MSGDTPDRGREGPRSVGSTGGGDSGLAGTFAPGTLISFTYRVEALLARGGMGEVYRTTHTEIGTQHAIKIVRPDLANDDKIMELFRREASVLRTVREDAIVGYDGVLRDEEGRVYLVMEFVDGPSLTEYLTGGTLTPQEVRDLRDRLARGLAAAHDKGVIHRDMSPDNIILGEGKLSQAKIIDFGIAKLADSSATTIIGDDFAGRYAYASPEQIGLYGGQVDARSDIYSLGLVLATAGTGKALNMGEISESLVSVIEARKRIPDFSSVPESLRNELGAMLQPDPADRPQSMREVIGLDSRLDSAGPQAAPEQKQQAPAAPLSAEPAARPTSAGGSARGWLWPAVTAGVAAAAVGGYFAWQNMAPPADPPQAVAQVDTAEPAPPQPEASAPAADTPPNGQAVAPVETPAEVPTDPPTEPPVQAPEEPTIAAPADEPPAAVVAEEADSQPVPEPESPSETAAVQTPAPAVPAVPAAEPQPDAEEGVPADTAAQGEEAGGAIADAAEAVAAQALPEADDAGVDTGEEPVPADTQQAAAEETAEAVTEETEERTIDQAEASAPSDEEATDNRAVDAQIAALPEPSEAERRAAALAAAEAALTRSEKLEIQRDLRALGHYAGGIDGSFGPGTRAGIERYQQVAGLEPTGYLDDAQRAGLASAAQAPRAEEAARLAAERQAAEQRAAAQQAAEAEAARAAEERRVAEEAAARARAVAQQRSAPARSTEPAVSQNEALGQQQAALPGESEMDRLRRVAEAGDPIAQASLGLRYYRGQGVRKDLEEAFRWTKQAAEQGEARAQSNLGFYYMNGEGVGRDPAQAARWWREAASQGLQQAQFNLGLLYETGRGVSADPQEAAKWYRLASEQGDRQAKSRLDGLVRRGLVSAEE
ncbi:protein kinase domain-containing protein [Pelagibius sp.]|uniref:protein kinase domain-containing protein n=1 Tax=Pelagibius sp. TaxID=1931238 RepID=UPI003BAEFF20